MRHSRSTNAAPPPRAASAHHDRGSHGLPPDSPCALVSVQAQEIGGGKETLEQWIGERVDTFAYPNGRPGADYDDHSIRLVRQAGFEHAFTTSERFAVPG